MRLPLLAVLVVPLATACASNPPPAPVYGAPGPAPAPPTDPHPGLTGTSIEGFGWTIAVPPDTAQSRDEYGGAVLASATFTLTVTDWPQADAFVQTLAEHLAGLRAQDPGLTVLHQHDGGRYQFEAVVETGGHVDGTVLVPGDTTGGLCAFELPLGADWRTPLAACQSLVVDGPPGEDEPADGADDWGDD